MTPLPYDELLERYANPRSFRDDLLPPIERFIARFVRFYSKIEIDAETGCWNWTAARDSHGYGLFGVNGRRVFAHRLAYMTGVGDIPEGLILDHLCKNTRCCNPDHLEPVTQHENLLRARRSQCANGHEYTADNTYWVWSRANGRRFRRCRTCSLEQSRRAREKRLSLV